MWAAQRCAARQLTWRALFQERSDQRHAGRSCLRHAPPQGFCFVRAHAQSALHMICIFSSCSLVAEGN